MLSMDESDDSMDFGSFDSKAKVLEEYEKLPGTVYRLNISASLAVDTSSLQAISSHSVIELLVQNFNIISNINSAPHQNSQYDMTIRVTKSLLQMQYNNPTIAANKGVPKQEDIPLISVTTKGLQGNVVVIHQVDKKYKCTIFVGLKKLKIPFQLTKVTRITAILQVNFNHNE